MDMRGDTKFEHKESIGKDWGMLAQKDLMASYYQKVLHAKESGKKIVYTFVPGNLNEIALAFDVVPVFPEILGLQMALRQQADHYIQLGEKEGYAEDLCSYVKSSVGMAVNHNIGPYGDKIPEPDFLFLINSNCFTFMKWFEILKKTFKCPIVQIHLPYIHEEKPTKDAIEYCVKQFKQVVVPEFERLTGNKFDLDKLKYHLELSRQAEEKYFHTMDFAKNTPCPFDAVFNGMYYIGPLNTAFRGTPEAVEYYTNLKNDVEARVSRKEGPITPFGRMDDQKYRIVLECAPPWNEQRNVWKIFYDEKVVVVGGTYNKVAGSFDLGTFHDPNRPFESLSEQVMSCYCNNNIILRSDTIEKHIRDYRADGFLVSSIKSCKSFMAGQLAIMRRIEERTGISGGFFECDMMDSRFYAEANVRNRIESYLRMIDQKGKRGAVA
ncbi:benzoyl-CoA reductase subunit B [Candidatus Parcubacteria bacterium]|nr:MAG: benzoyl-CoA reductase subunit B [Candidatus Parcubacteria bacterium]